MKDESGDLYKAFTFCNFDPVEAEMQVSFRYLRFPHLVCCLRPVEFGNETGKGLPYSIRLPFRLNKHAKEDNTRRKQFISTAPKSQKPDGISCRFSSSLTLRTGEIFGNSANIFKVG